MTKHADKAKDPKEPDNEADGSVRAAAERAFGRGVMVRGEAARSVDGELPPGATHEVVDSDEPESKDGDRPKVRRRRFSAF